MTHSSTMTRRGFLKRAGALAAAGTVPLATVEVAHATGGGFTFAYISDAHIQQIKGTEFVRNWDRGLIRAVAEANLLTPRPDFIMFGGDLAQLGKKEELDHGAEILSKLDGKLRCVMGEHDYYLDLGRYWSELFGPHYYSWDHKGVHFIVLNSVLTYDDWTFKRWPTAEQRMLEMAGLDNPNGSPFMVGEAQRAWLQKDLAGVNHNTPLVVFSHSPIQKIYKGWNFWTEDADEVQALLAPFKTVNVIYGHVHQVQYNQIGNIAFNAVMATAWPWPYPQSYAQAQSHLPKATVPMNRANPFFERDATGWQFVNIDTGRAAMHYRLTDNTDRVVAFNREKGQPEDAAHPDPGRLTAPQIHY